MRSRNSPNRMEFPSPSTFTSIESLPTSSTESTWISTPSSLRRSEHAQSVSRRRPNIRDSNGSVPILPSESRVIPPRHLPPAPPGSPVPRPSVRYQIASPGRIIESDASYRSSILNPSPSITSTFLDEHIGEGIEFSYESAERSLDPDIGFNGMANSPSTFRMDSNVTTLYPGYSTEVGELSTISSVTRSPSISDGVSYHVPKSSPSISPWEDSSATQSLASSRISEDSDTSVSWESSSTPSVRFISHPSTNPPPSATSATSLRTFSTRKSGRPSISSRLSTIVSSIPSESSTPRASTEEVLASQLDRLVRRMELVDHRQADANADLIDRTRQLEQEVLELSYFLRQDVEERRLFDMEQARNLDHLQQRGVLHEPSSSVWTTPSSSSSVSSVPETMDKMAEELNSPPVLSPKAPSFTISEIPDVSVSSLDDTPIPSVHYLEPPAVSHPLSPSSFTSLESLPYSPTPNQYIDVPEICAVVHQVEVKEMKMKESVITRRQYSRSITPSSPSSHSSSNSPSTPTLVLPPPSINPIVLRNRLTHLEEQHIRLLDGQREIQATLNDLRKRPLFSIHDSPSDLGVSRSLRHIEERLNRVVAIQAQVISSKEQPATVSQTKRMSSTKPGSSIKTKRKSKRRTKS